MIRSCLFFILVFSCAGLAGAQPFGYTPVQIQSLFTEDFRNEQYEDALVYGRWLIEAHPKEMEDFPATYRGDRNFSRMIDIYKYMADKQDDPSLREAYLDSAIQMYDRVIAIFTEDEIDVYRWYFNRGRFYQAHPEHISNAFQMALKDYETMLAMDAERTTKTGGGYYIQLMVQHYARISDREQAFSIINQAEPYADQSLLDFFAATRNELITDPEERIELITKNWKEDKGNENLMLELYELYQAVGNRDKTKEMAVKMYQNNPSVTNIIRLADKAEDNGDYRDAIRYISEAYEIKQDTKDKSRLSLRISNIYLSLRELQQARQFARRAAQEDPQWGEPFITIAQIYGQAVSLCAGGDMGRLDKAVYWLVLDYLDKANERNSSVRSDVTRLYRTYEPVTPTVEEKFYLGWETGDKLRIDGSLKECYSWIAEETTIR